MTPKTSQIILVQFCKNILYSNVIFYLSQNGISRSRRKHCCRVTDIAHGNFTPESPPTTEAPRLRDRISARDNPLQAEVPVAKQEDPTYMAVIIGVLTAVILLLAVAIFLIVTRHRQRKNFASPLGTKNAIPSSNHQHLSPESAYGTTEKDPSLMTYRVEELDDRYAGTKLTTLPRDLNDRLLGDVRLDEYQEPFYENKHREPPHAAYYGYSTVVIDNKDLHDSVEQSGKCNRYPTTALILVRVIFDICNYVIRDFNKHFVARIQGIVSMNYHKNSDSSL